MKNKNKDYIDLRDKGHLHALRTRICSGFRAFTRSPIPWLWTTAYWLLILFLPGPLAKFIELGTLGTRACLKNSEDRAKSTKSQ